MSELPRSAFRFDPELVRAFVHDRRAAELEHQVRVLRDLVTPVAVRCTDHAGGG